MYEHATREGSPDETEDAVIELLERIIRSPNRVRILDALSQTESLHWTNFRESCAVSRTTLTRNLESLQEAGWIACSNREYRITPCGNLIVDQLVRLIETTATASRLQDGLRWLQVGDLDLDLGLLADAEVMLPDPGDPLAMINRHVRSLRAAEWTSALLRITGLHAAEAAHRAIVHDGGSAEVIATPEVVRTLTTKTEYSDLTDEMLATGRFELFESTEPVPYSLVVIDDRTQLAVDEEGTPRAVIESRRDAVREWATGVIESYKQGSHPITTVAGT